jgi:hypothetical protein
MRHTYKLTQICLELLNNNNSTFASSADKDSIINIVKYIAFVFVLVRFIFLLKKVSNLWKK